MKFSIGTKLWMSFLSILMVLMVVGATVYQNTQKLISTTGWVVHTQEVQTRLAALLSLLQDAETGQRGYVITGEARYLEPYLKALSRLDDETANLRRLTQDNPTQQNRLAQLAPLIQAKLAEL